MSTTIRIIIDLFLILGVFFALAGTVGMLRMPDPYSRMQSSTNISTLGIINIGIAALIYAFATDASSGTIIKIILICVFTVISSPTVGHAISKATYNKGIHPDKEMTVDDYGRDHING